MSSSLCKSPARGINSDVLQKKSLPDLIALSGHVKLRAVYSACFKLFFHLAAASNVLTVAKTLDDFGLPKTISNLAQGLSEQAFPAMHTSAGDAGLYPQVDPEFAIGATSRHTTRLSVASA